MFIFELPADDLALLGFLNVLNLADMMAILEHSVLMYLVGQLDERQLHELLAYAKAAMDNFEVEGNE